MARDKQNTVFVITFICLILNLLIQAANCQDSGKSTGNLTGSSFTSPSAITPPNLYANKITTPTFPLTEKQIISASGDSRLPDASLPGIENSIPFPISIDFQLDWTKCQIHRANYDSAIVMILSGKISSSTNIFWSVRGATPGVSGVGAIYFIQDVLGRQGSDFGQNIPLTWEISLDSGPFSTIPIQPDGSLQVAFPPGKHNFQVRITGYPEHYAADGYYNLKLSQQLIPQL